MTRTLFAAAAIVSLTFAAHASTLTPLYSFCQKTNCLDGDEPTSPVIMDSAGNLYGTTRDGGSMDYGVVYELSYDSVHKKWAEQVLANFSSAGGSGYNPYGPLILDTAGNLYGTAASTAFNVNNGAGVAYELIKSQGWKRQILYTFCAQAGCADGDAPSTGLTYFGQSSGALYDGISPLYGTTPAGGANDDGVVFKLTPKSGKWSQTTLHSFCSLTDCEDGKNPGALTTDSSGNLLGTTTAKGFSKIFRMSTQGGEAVLYHFCAKKKCADGDIPIGIVFDAAGNILGADVDQGKKKNGVAFKLDTHNKFDILYNFCSQKKCTDGAAAGSLTLDASGDLLGVTGLGGTLAAGSIFKIAPGGAFTTLYSFCTLTGSCADGYYPALGLTLDSKGNIYGINTRGGNNDKGVVYEFTP